MVLLRILSGKMAGRECTARRLPFKIGRASTAGLCLTDDGVWEEHCEIAHEVGRGLVLLSHEQAVSLVNTQPATDAPLRNGDVIQLGAVTLQFWLAPPRQTGLRLREALTWLGILALAGLQFAAFCWLTR
jgi:hypothetical protein